jgi:very-short-patch-repair endonuclease
MEADPNTVLSDFHVKLIKWLERRGVPLLEEVEFPPYRVDIYVTDWHAAVEADGPHHTERERMTRDNWLAHTYGLYVWHVAMDDFNQIGYRDTQLESQLISFSTNARLTAKERYEMHKDKVPWI